MGSLANARGRMMFLLWVPTSINSSSPLLESDMSLASKKERGILKRNSCPSFLSH